MSNTPRVNHNPQNLFPQYQNYSHGVELKGDFNLLFISGLNGYESDGKTMPDSFEDQAKLIWEHIGSILRSADMSYRHIVSLRTYLADAKYDGQNVKIRKRYLVDNEPASTVICCQLLESRWKLEVEAIAAK